MLKSLNVKKAHLFVLYMAGGLFLWHRNDYLNDIGISPPVFFGLISMVQMSFPVRYGQNIQPSFEFRKRLIKSIMERKQKIMKRFLKGVAAVAIVMFITMLIHIFFNMRGIDLNRYINNVVEVMLTSSLSMLIYQALIKNEKSKDDRNEE